MNVQVAVPGNFFPTESSEFPHQWYRCEANAIKFKKSKGTIRPNPTVQNTGSDA